MRRPARFLPGILPLWLLLCAAGCNLAPRGEPPELLAQGKKYYAEKNWKQAERYMKGITKYHPTSEEAEEAFYLQAESQRHRRKGATAWTSYKAFVKNYPTSRFSVGVAVGEYNLGVDHLEGRIPGFLFFSSNKALGVEILEHMQLHFRNHSLAEDALIRASEYHIEEKEYESATVLLRRLLADYPRSRYRLRARYQAARCSFLMSRGPDYDERLLDEAKRGFKDFIGTTRLDGMEETYARQVAAAERMMTRIDARMAEKQYRIGRFYERREVPGSALYYYRYCMNQYPGTEYAKQSADRLTELEKELQAAKADEEEPQAG